MIRVFRLARATCAALVITFAFGVASVGAKAAPGIPIGPADENAETSRAITTILDKCAAVYEGIGALHATGDYLSVSKAEDSKTTYAAARVSLDFHTPDKLAIHCRSKTLSLDCTFLANGTTVTMAWANYYPAHIDKLYVKIPQPDSLAAFVDIHRTGGEILDDSSGAIAVACMPQMLVTDDTHEVLYANIERFIYEGTEEISGHLCHRIRFVQSSPDVNVIVWIDAASYLERKTSFIYSYNENYELVDSFEEGVEADMMVMTWDDITTDAAKVDDAAFKWKLPKGYEVYDYNPASSPTKETKSLWESLVSSAALAAPHETTWTVTRQQGDIEIRALKYLDLPGDFAAVKVCRLPGKTSQSLAIGTSDGVISFRDAAGAEQARVDLKQQISTFYCTETTSGEIMQIVATPKNMESVIGWDLDGKQLWEYRYPFAKIRAVNVADKEAHVYLALSNGQGLRRLGSDGKVEYAYVTSQWGNTIAPAPLGMDRVLYHGYGALNFFDKQLHRIDAMYADTDIKATRWDPENAAAPVIDVGNTDDEDVVLQRHTEDADVVWTTMIQPKLGDVSGYGLSWANISVDGKIRRCILCMLSSGHIVVTTEDGKALYRGLFDADAASIKRNGGSPVGYMAVADLDGDGTDEAYIKVDKDLVRLEFL